jgi:hypothetical protein
MMKKLFTAFLFLMLLSPVLFSQRIIFQSDFETIPLNSDSLPAGWSRFDEDGNNPAIKWAVRDTSVNFGGPTRPRAIGRRSLEIPWYAGQGGNGIANDFVFTDSFTVQTGDSLIFWMLHGSDTVYQPYLDSMEVGYGILNEPQVYNKIIKYVSNDSAGIPLNNNDWTEHKISLNSLAGQNVYLCFRYWMNTAIDGLWCNIDNVFIGNRSAIGIQNISSEVPKKFDLKQNYPNPFNPITNIEFDMAKSEFATLVVYNMAGQVVETLVNQQLNAGTYKVDFDASRYASGTYLYRLTAGNFVKTSKMILVK